MHYFLFNKPSCDRLQTVLKISNLINFHISREKKTHKREIYLPTLANLPIIESIGTVQHLQIRPGVRSPAGVPGMYVCICIYVCMSAVKPPGGAGIVGSIDTGSGRVFIFGARRTLAVEN